jgi:hypothetical protein
MIRAVALILAGLPCLAATQVEIGVMSLFQARTYEVQAIRGSILTVQSSSGVERLEGAATRTIRWPEKVKVSGPDGAAAEFVLRVPGRIERKYKGSLDIKPNGDQYLALVKMDLELAVASIIAAEAGSHPLEALRAHAVVTRSFLVASPVRHRGFHFCDTTHCQFLKDEPNSKSVAWQATRSTTGLVIGYNGKAVTAMYSSTCGGRTRTLQEAGWRTNDYPYFAVTCGACRGRKVIGHRVGLCQYGAGVLAKAGMDFRSILEFYYPGTVLLDWPLTRLSMP